MSQQVSGSRSDAIATLRLASLFYDLFPAFRCISLILGMELVRRRSPLWQQLATTDIHFKLHGQLIIVMMMKYDYTVVTFEMMTMISNMGGVWRGSTQSINFTFSREPACWVN